MSSVAVLALAAAAPGCAELDADDLGDDSSPHSDRGGIGISTVSQEVTHPTQVLDARKSVAVTDQIITSQFTLLAVMNQLATQNGNPGFTGTQLFRQMWETQNAAPSAATADLQPSAHCTDTGTTLNGFPNVCRPQEGAQANAANVTNINSYSAIGLFNRFDLAPANGANCGEYRVVFGKTGGGGGRSFIIFEAALPNPRTDLGLEGCRQVQAFWRDLSFNPNVNARATALRNFYFNGLPGYQPVIHMNNYGSNFANVGQIRINMFIQPVWDLKEFKLVRQCPGGVCVLKANPVSVKTNPFGDLFNPASPQPLAGAFRTQFINQVPALAVNDINRFNYDVPDQFNVGQSDSQSGGTEDDYLANFGGASAFRNAIQNKLTSIGSTLTPDQIVARAQALSCGGCHQRSNGASLGGGLVFPSSGFFVHSLESTEAGPDGTRFQLSSALTGTFLPFRKGISEDFLSLDHAVTGNTRFDMVGSAADGANVYWVENRASGSVVKASLNSGGEAALAFGRPNPRAVATDGTDVYWLEQSGSIFKVPTGGGTITTVATAVPGIGLEGIAVDNTNLYFTQNGTSIARMPKGGGAITTLYAGRVGVTGRIALDGAGGTQVLWHEGNNVVRGPRAPGAVTVLFTQPGIVAIGADASNVYVGDNLGDITRVGSGVIATGILSLTSIGVGSGLHLVWTDNNGPGTVVAKLK